MSTMIRSCTPTVATRERSEWTIVRAVSVSIASPGTTFSVASFSPISQGGPGAHIIPLSGAWQALHNQGVSRAPRSSIDEGDLLARWYAQ